MFIGREIELQRLQNLKTKKTASFIVVRGRRRIGKTRLINEFGKTFNNFFVFTGLAPDKKTTSQDQLNEFSRQLAREFSSYVANFTDWSDAFDALGQKVQSGPVLLLFDEISWMGSEDSTFLSKIKNLWDLYLKKNDKLIFVVCGSASSWIEQHIMQNTGFVGRISLTLTLHELSLETCRKFWPKNIAAYEIFFEQIFSSTFVRNSVAYIKILGALVNGAKTTPEILATINATHRGRIYEYLEELILAGFITRDYTWNLRTSQDAKASSFRLSDNYIRFYLKYIAKNLGVFSKFSKYPIGLSVIHEVQNKINALVLPKGISCRAVLIHVNGVTKDVIEEAYFAQIIDFSQLSAN